MHFKFNCGDRAIIRKTNSELDGTRVLITGVSFFDVVTNQATYMVEKVNGDLFTYLGKDWKSLGLTQHCLVPV